MIKHLKPFDWVDKIEFPLDPVSNEGSQLFRFINRDKPYKNDPNAIKFVETYLLGAKRQQSDADVMRIASVAVTIQGFYLEMGTCTGKSINFIAALNPHQIIHGFDSFEGLPEDWVRSDLNWKKGTFAFKDKNMLPPVHHNVRLYKGLFKDVLPAFKAEVIQKAPIAFLHIDCDLYQSTKDVFESLGDNLVNGSIILFDELYNYPGSEEHEWKAFQEFIEERQFKVEFLAFNEYHEQVAVKII